MNTEDDEFKRVEREQAMRGVPDAIHYTDNYDSADYISGWNACRQAMMAALPAQQESGVKGYAMALNEIALKLRERYKTDLLATPLWAEFEKARNKFAASIAAPQAQRKPLTPTLEADTGYSRAQRAAFKEGWEEAEAAHGIKENT